MPLQKKLSIAIPFYNEESELPSLLRDVKRFEKINHKLTLEYIFINDNSSDKSVFLIKNLKKKLKNKFKKKIKIISNKKNLGFAKSVIKGLKKGKSENLLFIPGDGEARLSQFCKNLPLDKDLIVFQREDMTSRPPLRIIISFLYKFIVCSLFFINIIDLNGVLLIKKKKFNKLKICSNSPFINAEIIIKSIKMDFSISTEKYFKLFAKKKYKSTSLSLNQFYKIAVDMIKAKIFIFKL